MKLGEIKEKINTFIEEERKQHLNALWNLFCPISQYELKGFQERWDWTRSYEEFVSEQNKMFVKLIEIETSVLGNIVRRDFGLKVISLETEV